MLEKQEERERKLQIVTAKKELEKKRKEAQKEIKKESEKTDTRRYRKPVLVIKKEDGAIMSRHASLSAAAKVTGFSIPFISKVCRGEAETRGIYTFRYENPDGDPEDVQAIWRRKPACKPIMQFNLRGEFIAKYNSQKEAAEKSGCWQACISKCCRHEYSQTNGFIFMFESEFNEIEKGKQK
jgi:hypothetical protein